MLTLNNLERGGKRMRNIVFYGAISLDGYLSTTTDNLQWLFDTDTGPNGTTYEAFSEIIDTVVMGRITYAETIKLVSLDEWIGDKQPIVFTRNSDYQADGVTIVTEDPVEYLKDLRQKDGKAIWIVGGGNLLKPLVEADLIDEWWIQIAPVLLGKGKKLFQEGDYSRRLEFVETTQMGELIELHYRRKK